MVDVPCISAKASSLVRVILSSFQDDGRRDSLCFTSMCDALTY